MGRLVGTTTSYSFLPGHTYTNSYTYDAASNRTGFTAPDGSTNTYTYDTLGRLTTLTDSAAGQFTFSYDALSRRTALTRPNGVNTTYAYDAVSNLQSILHKLGLNTFDGATYAYDSAHNRTSKANFLNSAVSNYSYDSIYQLTGVTGPNPEAYTYDPVGNRLSSQNIPTYTYNSSNELISGGSATYIYDGNGNTLTKTDSIGTTTYTWDFENRLASVQSPGQTTVTFRYDPFGRRIQKGTNVYQYAGLDLVEVTDSTGTEVGGYVFGPGIDEPLTAFRGAAIEFYQADGLGSITSLSTDAGLLSDTFGYDSFGNVITATGTFAQPFRFTGREWDGETGLHYYRARYYDSTVGRFLSEDPVGWVGGSNFYIYVDNNALNFVDPSGYIPIPATMPWWWGVGGVSSGTAGGVLAGLGRLAGPIGVAGTAGWGIGRGVGHIPIYGGGTVDDGWQQIFTILFFSQAAQSASSSQACKKDDAYCSKKKQECMRECLPFLGKGGRTNQGFPYRNCIRSCLKKAGCEGYGDFW